MPSQPRSESGQNPKSRSKIARQLPPAADIARSRLNVATPIAHVSPILLRLPLHCRRVRVLRFDPTRLKRRAPLINATKCLRLNKLLSDIALCRAQTIMSVVAIYHPRERDRMQPLADALSVKGCDIVMAPLGFQVGSPEWIKQARTDIESAVACILLLSKESMFDPWVEARLSWALERKIRIVPFAYSEFSFFDFEYDRRYDRSNPNPAEEQGLAWWVAAMQWLQIDESEPLKPGLRRGWSVEEVAEAIFSVLRPLLPVTCFLSYSRKDQEFADRLQAALRQNGIECWRDTSSISGGAVWDTEIEKAIKKCSCVLLLASRSAFASENVSDEISYARNNKKLIVPILIEQVDLPFRIHRAQAIDFQDDFDGSVQKLLSAIRPDRSSERAPYYEQARNANISRLVRPSKRLPPEASSN
jgi:hypothetical protein